MAAAIAYTLPAMQLVCHLVASGNSGNDVTNSATTQQPLEHNPVPLPDGYVAKPDIGFAYKYHSTKLNSTEAQKACIQEGAGLAVIDSPEKMEYFTCHATGVDYLLAGIIRTDGIWINVNTEELIPATVVWLPNSPSKNGNCVLLTLTAPRGLRNYGCGEVQAFFCEIPILANSTRTVN